MLKSIERKYKRFTFNCLIFIYTYPTLLNSIKEIQQHIQNMKYSSITYDKYRRISIPVHFLQRCKLSCKESCQSCSQMDSGDRTCDKNDPRNVLPNLDSAHVVTLSSLGNETRGNVVNHAR